MNRVPHFVRLTNKSDPEHSPGTEPILKMGTYYTINNSYKSVLKKKKDTEGKKWEFKS